MQNHVPIGAPNQNTGYLGNRMPLVGPTMAAALECILFGQGLYPNNMMPPGRMEPAPISSQQVSSSQQSQQEIVVDVKHFSATDLTVKVVNKTIVVKGKYKQRLERHAQECWTSRKLVKAYRIGEDVDINSIRCQMTLDNFLTIYTPLKKPVGRSRLVPIHMTGQRRFQMAGMPRRLHFVNKMSQITVRESLLRGEGGNVAAANNVVVAARPRADMATQYNGQFAEIATQTDDATTDEEPGYSSSPEAK